MTVSETAPGLATKDRPSMFDVGGQRIGVWASASGDGANIRWLARLPDGTVETLHDVPFDRSTSKDELAPELESWWNRRS